jgi:hypothetical protein
MIEKITTEQLNLMKHAIGLDRPKAKPKRGKYTAYRNYYCSYEKNEDWEYLVGQDLATAHKGDPELYPASIFYHVSEKGIKLMEIVLGFKIVESD